MHAMIATKSGMCGQACRHQISHEGSTKTADQFDALNRIVHSWSVAK
jgi:hypothetical protein